jgi:autotransporter-associated beta strand protein
MKPNRKNALLLAFPLASAFAALVVAPSALAGNTWDGGGADANWLTPANWDLDAVAVSPTALTFAGDLQNSTTNDFAADTAFNGINFTNSGAGSNTLAFTLAGARITLGGNIATTANTAGTTITDTISLNMILSGNRTITTNQQSASVQHNLRVNGIISESAPSTLTKAGAGTLTLGGPNTYTGTTILGAGTLAYTADNTLTGGLTFGAANNSTTPGSLDLSAASATFGGPFIVQGNSATAHTITIGASKTLATNGDVTIGTNGGAGRITNLNVSGATGSWTITNSAAAAKFQVGGATGTTNTNPVTADLSGLGTFNANLSGATSVFRVGSSNTAATDTLTILKLAVTSTITANTVGVGDVSGEGAPAKLLSLGTGVNTINANLIRIGDAIGQRSSGIVNFQDASNGSLIIRSQLGTTGVANLTMVSTNNAGANNHSARLLLAGHNVDVSLNAIVMASRSSGTGGSGTAEITFDTGTFSANTIAMTGRTGTTVNGPATGTITIGGGTASLGAVTMAVNTNTNAATGLATADLNINNGTVTAATINMANAVATGSIKTATANINLSGGSLTLAGDITRTGGTGTENATITLNGGTLNMAGNDIGTGSAAITFIAQSGALQNVATLNGTGGLTKTTAGTLILSGTNSYTGTTTVDGGTLIVNGAGLTGGGPVALNGGTLGGSGTVAGLVTTSGLASILSPGNSPGTLTLSGGLDATAGATFNAEVGTATDLITMGAGVFTGSSAAGGLVWNFSNSGGLLAGTAYTLAAFGSSSGLEATDFSAGTLPSGFLLDPAFGTGGFQINATNVQVRFAVPEPTTTALLVLLGAALRRRR